VPEWYFLPYYAILRAFTADWFVYNILSLGGFIMTAKLMGVLAMFASILLLLFLPWLDGSKVKSSRFRPVHSMFVWIFVLDCIVLGICGAKPAEGMWLIIGQTATIYYFAHLLFIIPIVSRLERPMMPPESIAASVMVKAAA
jgi:quinol-cytochrome oxidoreductase complex cytochrome b subunit